MSSIQYDLYKMDKIYGYNEILISILKNVLVVNEKFTIYNINML